MMRLVKGHREIVRAHRANMCLRPKELVKFDRRIIFDVLFAIRALVGYFAGGEIHVIAHHSRAPASRKELWKCAFTSLIDSKSPNQGFPIKGRYVHGARHERNAFIMTGPCAVRNKLWHAGSDQMLRVTPACRRLSARYGNPPTFGRMAAALCIAAFRLSIAVLMKVPLLSWCKWIEVRSFERNIMHLMMCCEFAE
jgi:hypothetical protein